MPSVSETQSSALRDVVYSLNALLKFARLYGLHHARSDQQFEDTWTDLKAAIAASSTDGLMIGASGTDFVLNGTVLESSPAERSLAQILAGAGIASVVFLPGLLEDSFLDFVKAFARGAAKPSELLRFLKHSFEASPERGIRINEIRFVPTRARSEQETQNWLREPAILSEILGAGDLAKQPRRFSSFEFGEELLGGFDDAAFSRPITEKQTKQLIELVAEIGVQRDGVPVNREEWQHRLRSLPENAKAVLQNSLGELAGKFRLTRLDDLTLLRLSNDLAICCAVEQFESGTIGTPAIRTLLNGFSSQIAQLRAGFRATGQIPAGNRSSAETQTDALERQFWASVSEGTRQRVLLSNESWCVPARNIQQCVKELQRAGNGAAAQDILQHYACCVTSKDLQARKKAATGLNQLAGSFTSFSGALSDAIRIIGEQLHRERDAELQGLLSATFVKLSHAAAERREFPAVQRMLHTLDGLEKSRPTWTQALRPRIGFDNRIPELVEEVLAKGGLHSGFVEVMRRVPDGAASYLATRLMRVTRASERDKVVEMSSAIGEPLQARLCETLELAPLPRAVRVAGLLSRLQPAAVMELLPRRIASGTREIHDEALRQLSIAGAPERGQMLMSMIERLDPMILPMALDEIGMCGDVSVAPELLRLAEGQRLPQSSDFLQVKAIEALGRLRVASMEPHLLRFVEEKRAWRWRYPAELRLAAAQALVKLDAERAQVLLSNAGLDARLRDFAPLDPRADRDFVRSRRYQRVRMAQPVSAVVQSSRGKCQPEVHVLSLEGGLLSGNLQLSVGAAANLRISSGIRPIHLNVLVRFAKANQAGVETVGMELEDRSRLRNLLISAARETAVSRRAPLSILH